MATNLHDRLADLAADAPQRLPSAGLWSAGVRHRRVRRAQGVLVVALVAAVVGGLWVGFDSPEVAPPQPADPPAASSTCPGPSICRVNGRRATRVGPPGVLAVLAAGVRREPEGWFGSSTRPSLFGVSAVDGSVRFLDLPFTKAEVESETLSRAVLAPDGRTIGYPRLPRARQESRARWSGGWSTTPPPASSTSSSTRSTRDRGHGHFEIVFTGDSRYLATNYSRTLPATSKSDQLVVWDVETGERIPVEEPGKYWDRTWVPRRRASCGRGATPCSPSTR